MRDSDLDQLARLVAAARELVRAHERRAPECRWLTISERDALAYLRLVVSETRAPRRVA